MTTTHKDRSRLHAEFSALRAGEPRLRIRDAATRLDTSEADLLLTGLDGAVTTLRPDWRALLTGLEAAGRVMALTRNSHAVHERHGVYRNVSFGPGHALILDPEIDLRIFLGQWKSAIAVDGAERRSIQIFDAAGHAVHKIFTTPQTSAEAWQALVDGLADRDAAISFTPSVTEREVERPIDAHALRADWEALKDTHDFVNVLRKHGATRRQAFSAAGSDLAMPSEPAVARAVLEAAAKAEVPIMVFVGNRGCIQIHTGTVHRLVATGPWFNVLDPDFNLHLRADAIASAWRVRKPTVDGVVTSIELLDEAGGAIATLFGARKPGQPERPDWRAIAEDCAQSHAQSRVLSA